MIKKAPARESDKQQMQAPNMGEIKKRRSQRWKVTTMGGRGGKKLCNRNGAEDWRKKKQPCFCKYAKPVRVTVNHSVLLNILTVKDEQESRAHR